MRIHLRPCREKYQMNELLQTLIHNLWFYTYCPLWFHGPITIISLCVWVWHTMQKSSRVSFSKEIVTFYMDSQEGKDWIRNIALIPEIILEVFHHSQEKEEQEEHLQKT